MAKLSKKELDKVAQQMPMTARRGDTFVGFRPCVMDGKKYNKKAIRREGKAICRAYV